MRTTRAIRGVTAALCALISALGVAACGDGPEEAPVRAVQVAQGSMDAGPNCDGGGCAPPSPFVGGDGSASDPYLINSCTAVQAMEDNLSAHYRLTWDIDCYEFDAGDGHGFRPVGSSATPFTGSLHGNEFQIAGIQVNRTTTDEVGLFGATQGATIWELGTVSTDVTGNDYVGKLVGRASATTIREVYAVGVSRGHHHVGGLVGRLDGASLILNSYQLGSVECWDQKCGILLGQLDGSTVETSYGKGSIWDTWPPLLTEPGSVGTVTESFFDCDVAWWCRPEDPNALPTEDLQDPAFLSTRGWNFSETWGLDSVNPWYPCLQWQWRCEAQTQSSDDTTCDGVDDDGDGEIDEDYASESTECGLGACAATGSTSCVDGEVVDSCTPGTPAANDATCDNVDNDCDGSVDEDFASVSTSCGMGACSATGTTSCVNGSVEDSCTPGTGAPSDPTCNGVDDDCDGAIDDDYTPQATSCGVGACAATGATSCVAGTEVNSCTPGTPAPADMVCDGIDNDCDGASDEDYAPAPTTCGVGVCAAAGITSCAGGVVVDSCSPGAPTGDDSVCDGLDNNCNGTIDEGFVTQPTSCGVGACTGTGTLSCVAGEVVDSCVELGSATFDLTCDGVDDDCDGEIDEDYLPQPASCGVGACASIGFTSCNAGVVEDSCEEGTAAAADATCNGIDDDCDGETDENYVDSATSCGTGICGGTGTLTCVSGVEYDSCREVAAAFDDTTCDGVDDDCDGMTDEDCCVPVTCADLGASCGILSDGCGDIMNCGFCFDAAGDVCGSDLTCRQGVGVQAGPDLTAVWGETITVGANNTLTRVTDGQVTTTVIDCVWDFGDGTVVDRPNCKTPNPIAAEHAYAEPGTYVVTLTAVAAGGATDADTIVVTVTRRPTTTLIESVSASGSGVDATARVFDDFDPAASMDGRALSIEGEGSTVSGNADGAGRFTGSLTLPTVATVPVSASFAGDPLYGPSSSSTDITIDANGSPSVRPPPPSGHEGRRFMLGFTQNTVNIDIATETGEANELFVHLSTAVSQVVTIRALGIGFETEVPVLAEEGRRVEIPEPLRMGPDVSSESDQYSESGRIEDKGLELEGAFPFAVHAMDQISRTTDGYLGLPVDRLGTDYIVLAYPNEKLLRGFQQSAGTQVGIVAAEDGTQVSITPSRDVSPGTNLPAGILAGTTTTVTLDAGQTLQLANQGSLERLVDFEDLSGTEIRSNHPVAVFAGHACSTVVDPFCDHMIEQLPPVDAWGRRFFTAPLATRINNDVFRFIASRDGTTVQLDGEPLVSLDRGETHFFEIASDRSTVIEASDPILLAQHSKGQGNFTTVEADPFMVLVPPAEQYPSSYRLITPTRRLVDFGDEDFRHYFNLLVRADQASGVRVNGRFINPLWRPAGDSGWVGAQINTGPGPFSVDHVDGDVPIGMIVYGFGNFDSYGYPAGWAFDTRACEPTTMSPGDRVDNDCDGREDEEIPNGVDDDGDGDADEDLLIPSIAENLPPVAESFRAFAQISDGNTTRTSGLFPLRTSTYTLRGFDPNGDALTFEMVTPPPFSQAEVVGRSLRFTAIRSNELPTGWTGVETIEVRAFDGELYSNVATVTLDVNGGLPGRTPCDGPQCGNVAPDVVTNRAFFVPLEEGATSAELVDRLEAYDANRDPITYTLITGPPGLTLDSQNGDIRWTATRDDVGDHPISIDVTDGRIPTPVRWNRFVRVTYDGSNGPPVIVSTPFEGPVPRLTSYVYDVDAIDPEGQAITYTLEQSPAFFSIDADTGVLGGTFNDTGRFPFTVRATDSEGASSTQSFNVTFIGAGPLISTDPVLIATQGVRYTYDADALHPTPGEPLTWRLVTGPTGMTIDPTTGRVEWTPAADQLGAFTVRVEVDDTAGVSDGQTYAVVVLDRNGAPRITSTPSTRSVVDGLYVYDADATDPDAGDVLTFSLTEGPPGMVLDPSSGVIQWIPDVAGTIPVEVTVTDLAGNMDRQAFAIEVQADELPPSLTLVADPERFAPDETTSLQVSLTGSFSPSSVTLEVAGTPLTLSPDLTAEFTTAVPGVYVAVAQATDASGNVGTATVALSVNDGTDNTPPVVAITSPEEDATLTYLHDVVGTASDANLAYYEVALRRTNETEFVTLFEGYNSVTDDVLGILDTTMLENGWYELRVFAEDVAGLTAEDSRRIRIDGGAKVGVVQLSFLDLELNFNDIPLQVIRSYDSRIRTSEDFGFGWTLEIDRGYVQHSRPIGEFNAIFSGQDPFELPCRRTFEQRSHFTEVRLGPDEWYLFRPVIANTDPVGGTCVGDVFFELVDGTDDGAQLLVLGNTQVRSSVNPPTSDPALLFDSQLFDVFTGELFDPQRVQLLTKDGRIVDLHVEEGIERITDSRGITIQFREDRIVHSAVERLSYFFLRDEQQRITEIRRPGGGVFASYRYDSIGNLVGFSNVRRETTRFLYENPLFPHYLTAIIDRRGNRVAAFEYGADGRLSALCDADEVCSESSYDLENRTWRQTDPSRRPITYEYDLYGNVTAEIDALDNRRTFTYDAFGRELSQTDALGNVTRKTWEGSLLASEELPHRPTEDPADFTTTYTTNGRGRHASVTFPTGGGYFWDYHPIANWRVRMRDTEGSILYERPLAGNPVSETDRFGTRSFSYFVRSRIPYQTTEADGSVTSQFVNWNGDLVQISNGERRALFSYDLTNRPTTTDYGNGITMSYGYGDEEDWTSLDISTVGHFEREFSSTGRLSSWTMPNGDTFSRRYDGAGRIIEEVDELGNRTLNTYDLAGRLESVTDEATGGVSTFQYDAAGNVTRRVDAEDNEWLYTYEDGELVSMRDPNGGLWQYDRSPEEVVTIDPLGRTTTQRLSPLGLPESVEYPGGSTTSSTFFGSSTEDEAGRTPLSESDESGRARSFSYDSRSGLAGATWPGRTEEWQYEYTKTGLGLVDVDPASGSVSLDLLGGRADPYRYSAAETEFRIGALPNESQFLGHRLSSITTPSGDETRWTFDDQGRTTRIDYPWDEAETWVYGADGPVDTQTLADGTVLTYEHDDARRETSRLSSTGHNRSTVYGPGDRVEQVTGPTGAVDYAYDTAGRLASISTPAGGAVETRVEYDYDRLGQVTEVRVVVGTETFSTTYTYDGLGNITEMVDATGTTTWTYDLMGRPDTQSRPNGVETRWDYDDRDRVTSVVHEHVPTGTVVASRTYVRTASGEPTRIDNEDGSYVDITYDEANRVAEEVHRDNTGTMLVSTQYTYDIDGNRATRTVGGVTETYVYDPGAQLREVTVGGVPSATFGYDGAGRTTQVVRAGQNDTLDFDPDGNVVGINDGGTPRSVYAFDGEGRRERVVHDGVERRFLVAPAMGDGFESPHAVVDASGSLIARWVYAGEHAVMRVSASGEVTYFHRDSMGSVLGKTNAAGAVRARFHYGAFGDLVTSSGADAALPSDTLGESRFQGMWLDLGGFYFVRARSYDVETGRFLSRDPLATLVHTPRTSHPYFFAAGNPFVFSDPSGLFITTLGEASISSSIAASIVATVTFACVVNAIVEQAGGAAGATGGQCGRSRGTCESRFPHLKRCTQLPYWYRFNSRRAALGALQFYEGGARLRFHANRPTLSGPCPRQGSHINVRFARGGSRKAGTILTCRCCVETGSGPVETEQCAARTRDNFFL